MMMPHQKINIVQPYKHRRAIKNKKQINFKKNKKSTLKKFLEEEIHNYNGIYKIQIEI